MRVMLVPAVLLAGCDLLEEKLVVPEPLSDCKTDDGDSFEYGSFSDTAAAGVSVDGDTLSVDVSYGGGCEEHEWVLCWPDQAFLEEVPVQASLEIWHGVDSDTRCDAYLSETLAFDLTPLKEQYQDGYQTETGTISISVGGESVDYTF